MESAISNLLVSMAGANYIHDAAGLFDGDLSISYEKLLMDNEILGMCERVLRGIDVNSETLAVDLIEKVGPGGDFLAQEHTVMNMENEFYDTNLTDRTLYEEWVSSGRQDMKMRTRVKLDELIKTYNPCYISDAKSREIRSRFPDIRD